MGPMGPAGFRRRGRRRGLIVGAAVGAAAANHANRRAEDEQAQAAEDDLAASNQDTGASNSQIEQLERLGQLRADGTLTDEEFAVAKQQVLGI